MLEGARSGMLDYSNVALPNDRLLRFLASSKPGKTPFAKLVRDDFLPDAGPMLPSGLPASPS